jgi:hypothetical protein
LFEEKIITNATAAAATASAPVKITIKTELFFKNSK